MQTADKKFFMHSFLYHRITTRLLRNTDFILRANRTSGRIKELFFIAVGKLLHGKISSNFLNLQTWAYCYKSRSKRNKSRPANHQIFMQMYVLMDTTKEIEFK